MPGEAPIGVDWTPTCIGGPKVGINLIPDSWDEWDRSWLGVACNRGQWLEGERHRLLRENATLAAERDAAVQRADVEAGLRSLWATRATTAADAIDHWKQRAEAAEAVVGRMRDSLRIQGESHESLAILLRHPDRVTPQGWRAAIDQCNKYAEAALAARANAGEGGGA